MYELVQLVYEVSRPVSVSSQRLRNHNTLTLSLFTMFNQLTLRIFGVCYTLLPVSLGAFAELRKATISFVMCVRPSVRMEQLDCHWTDIYEILYSSICRKSVGENSNFLKIVQYKNNGCFT